MPSRTPDPALRWRDLSIYALPAAAVAAPSFFVQFYFLSFATDVLLLSPIVVGVLLAGGRIWDAVSDPIVGYGSDRTSSRWGRRRPWLALAAPASALSFVALWNPPAAIESPQALAVWCGVALFFVTAGLTAWSIPHQAWAIELTDDGAERTRIFGARFAVSLVGVALSFVGMQLVATSADGRATAAALSLTVGVAMLVILLVPPLALREREVRRQAMSAPPFQAFADVLRNRDQRRLLATWFLAQMGMASQGVIAPYMARYVFDRPDLTGVFPALFIGPLMLSIPVWIRLAKRFGRAQVWKVSMYGGSVSYALLFFLPVDHLGITAVLLACSGFWTGCTGPLGPTFFADLVDDEFERSGERREGVVFASKEIAEKASSAAVAFAVGLALQLAAFEPNVEQSETVQWVIRGCLGVLPAGALLAAALVFRSVGHLADGDAK